MKTLTDTTSDAERMLADIYRRMPPTQKIGLVQDAWLCARQMHAAGYRLRFPRAAAQDIGADWLDVTIGSHAPRRIGAIMEEMSNLWKIVFDLFHVFDGLKIDCALGGSMASSIFGKPRFTQDADLTAAPFPGKEQAFAESLDTSYYVSLEAVQQAVREQSSFNVIHTISGFKIDVFVRKDTPFGKSAFERRRIVQIADKPVFILSPEDIILHKLEWFRLGGGVSDRQWGDILGVLQVQKECLEFAYLERWAEQLGLTESLTKACQESC